MRLSAYLQKYLNATIILWINSENPCFYGDKSLDVEKVLDPLKKSEKDRLIVREPAIEVLDGVVKSLIEFASDWNAPKTNEAWDKIAINIPE